MIAPSVVRYPRAMTARREPMPTGAVAFPRQLPGLPDLIARRMTGLLITIRASDRLIRARGSGLNEAEWRIVACTGFHGPLLVSEVADLLDIDRAQASRSAERLLAIGLLQRDGKRGAVSLASPAQEIYARLRAHSQARNALLIAGLSDDDLRHFRQLLQRVGANAVSLAAAAPKRHNPSVERQAKLRGDIYAADPALLDDTADFLVAPAIQFVMRAVIRFMAIEPSSEFSRVEWSALAWINNFGAVPLLRLIAVMDRDKSQIGRAVKTLVDRGMIRAVSGVRRAITLEIEPAGHTMVTEVTAAVAAKEQKLFAGIEDHARAHFSRVIDHLSEQAARLLAYDRAVSDSLFSSPG